MAGDTRLRRNKFPKLEIYHIPSYLLIKDKNQRPWKGAHNKHVHGPFLLVFLKQLRPKLTIEHPDWAYEGSKDDIKYSGDLC